MRKELLTALSITLIGTMSSAQVELKTSDFLSKICVEREIANLDIKGLAAQMEQNETELIIRYNSAATLDEIEEAGGRIVSLVGTRTAIVAVPALQASAVARCKGVTGATLSKKLKRNNNRALPASGVTDVRNGMNLPGGLDGKDVVIGLFDVGIDPNHISFQDADGNSRVKRVWYYYGQNSTPREYDTEESIKGFTSDSGSESHGTHVLGIMGGSFYDASAGQVNDYRGVAPGAEIVVACGPGYNGQLLDAMERIGAYAEEQGKPCVINLSFGDNIGPHDGTDEFTEALNDIAKKYNATLCLAAGNERDMPIAIVKTLSEDNKEIKTLVMKSEDSGSSIIYGPMDIWTTDDTPFEVTIDIIDKMAVDTPVYSLTLPAEKETYVAQGNTINQYLPDAQNSDIDIINSGTVFQDMYSNSFMGGHLGLDSYNNRYRALLSFYMSGKTAAVKNNKFICVTVKGEPGQKIFMYIDGTYMILGSKGFPGFEEPDGYGTNSNMASGKETFSVGSYVSANRPSSGYPSGMLGTLSYFSSYGETGDGRIMPDAVAPGQVIISSRNGTMPTTGSSVDYYPLDYRYTDTRTGKTYYWTSCAGTSQASPHVAGIMALVRSVNPELSYQEVYEIVRTTADQTTDIPYGGGYGKVNAFNAVKMALDMSSVNDLVDREVDSIIITPTVNGYEIYAAGAESTEIEIYNISGLEVSRLSGEGNSLTVSTLELASGIYLMRVRGGNAEKTVKILK